MATNIITAQIKGRSAIADQHAYQYDYGMILKISGVDLPTAYQVDFSNEPIRGTAYQQIGNADGVAIPDACFESGDDIFAWVYLHSGEDDGETVYQIMIPVYKRSKTSGETPTPAQQSAIDEAIAALNEAVESADASAAAATEAAAAAAESAAQAATSAEGVEHYAQEAAASAEEAAGYVATVSEYASQAAASATAAASSATSANQSAEEADTSADAAAISATNAAASATAASGSATTATQKATEAANSATAASGSASAASSSATNAAGSATQAAGSATQAAGSATSASQSATAAAGSATEAAASATSAAASAAEAAETAAEITADLMNKADVITDTASGSIVSIPDGMASPAIGLNVNIELIQDLHGYDNPWPAGGGKNKLPNKSLLQGTTTLYLGQDTNGFEISLKAGTYTISYSADEQVSIYYAKSTDSSGTSLGGGFAKTVTIAEDGDYRFWLYRGAGSGGIPTNVKDWQLEAGSTATSYAPYSNICPISGRSEVSVTRTGKNLLNPDEKTTSNDNVYFYANSGCLVRAGETYTLSYFGAGTVNGIYATKYNVSPREHVAVAYGKKSLTFTPSEDTVVYFNFYWNNTTHETADEYFQLETGSASSAYEPYQAQTVTVQLGQTVYGGTLYASEGRLEITHKYWTDNGSASWGEAGSGSDIRYYVGDVSRDSSGSTNGWCNMGNMVSNFNQNGVLVGTNGRINLCGALHSAFTDTTDLKTYLSSNPIQVVYELATPVEITGLTPVQISTLYGENNVWTDSGDTTVKYRADTKLWILKKIAQALNS